MEGMPSEEKKPVRTRAVLRAYGRAALTYPYLLAAAVLSMLLIELASVVAPLFLKRFINILAAGNTADAVISAVVWTLVAYAAVNFIGWIGQRIRMYSVGRLEARVMADLYDEAFSYLLRHSHDFFISNFTGTLTRRVSRYARAFEQVFDNFVMNLIPAGLFLLGVVGILMLSNLWLGAGLFCMTVLFIYMQYIMVMWLQPLRERRTAEDSHVTGALSDAVLNHSTIVTFGAASYERSIFKDVTGRWRDATRAAMDAYAWIYGVQGLIATFIEIAILSATAYLWFRGVLTVGDFVLVQIYVIGLLNQVWSIGRNMRHLHDGFTEASEMIDIMEQPHEIVDVAQAPALKVSDGAIAFDHIVFHYKQSAAILDDLTLTIAPKEKVALVGSSGAGKTTIAKLLLRLYDLTSGSISIDGQDIAGVTQESLERSIAFVPQEPMLFHRSLMDNIRYGRQDATDEEVIEAAKRAHCYEFIATYPLGFDTMVGERGVKLSGGERQRIAIARAILKDAPILVLDEATSSLDSESERLIQEALFELMKGKTVIAIAHRLSTIMHMDRIIVLEKGSVVLTGTHGELLSHESNLYKKLWDIQAGGFIGADTPAVDYQI